MISSMLALAALSAPPAADEARFRECTDLVRTAPAQAVERADAWRLEGGGLWARQCLGLGYAAQERWAPAAAAFEQAAAEAEKQGDAARTDFLVQAGNAWLAGGDPAKATRSFDAALSTRHLTPEMRGQVHLDRARAGVALGDAAAARADLDKGLELVPADPFAWYLSAALAMNERRLDRARADIERALALAPGDADIRVQAGNIMGMSGDIAAARAHFAAAVRIAPDGPAGRAATAALAANPEEPAE